MIEQENETRSLAGKIRYVIEKWDTQCARPITPLECFERLIMTFYPHMAVKTKEGATERLDGSFIEGEMAAIPVRYMDVVPAFADVRTSLIRIQRDNETKKDDITARFGEIRMPYAD